MLGSRYYAVVLTFVRAQTFELLISISLFTQSVFFTIYASFSASFIGALPCLVLFRFISSSSC